MNNSTSEIDHVDSGRRGQGCVTVIALGLCALVMVVAGLVGGGVSYLVARTFSSSPVAGYVGGGVVAFIIVWVTSPAGIAIHFFFIAKRSGTVTRSLVALLAAFVGPMIQASAIFVFAALAAVAGGLLFHWCERGSASLLVGVLFPLWGLVTGLIVGDPDLSSND